MGKNCSGIERSGIAGSEFRCIIHRIGFRVKSLGFRVYVAGFGSARVRG